ncbi:hypothetical protein B0A48_02511 [Cryoendolithus antarcticus]|uniref:HMG box domain-containing protein n=1 Tax=Cryoendolithus antarcticus TaxID=1507870 RepID=A0A1V8TNU8_9PEZI|nr:hypothetical protein B0A48_02511 [Cryoendolithus antarcticus]
MLKPVWRVAAVRERPDRGAKRNGQQEQVTASDNCATSPLTRNVLLGGNVQVCLCQPDPKIPRPRNAFILYRQHHQAKVVAQHPGLANPDISKIIGEQWRNQPNEVKNEWKALAEEEKIRHQQQYPTYRYQPKRNGRRNSITSDTPGSATSERPRCNKCGGRAILAPSTPYTTTSNATSPSHTHLPGTPGSGPTPISRTLPILRDLSLHSPAAHRMRQYAMTPSQHHPDDAMETIWPLSPDAKRRRFNEHPPQQLHRTMPPRYPTAPPQNIHPGPGTPFPFGPTQQTSVYAQVPSHLRRDSLPGLRGMVSAPGPMPPPPRPGMGYQQHRMSQGGPDRSLTLPPLQTGTSIHHQPSHSAVATPRTSIAKPVDVDLPFRYKLDVLRQIAPPAPIEKGRLRGPLVSIEGEDIDAVKGLASWLASQLAKDGDVDVKVEEGPLVRAAGSGSEAMANHHDLAADWLRRNEGLLKSLQYGGTTAETPSTAKPTTLVRRIEEILDDDDDATPTKASPEAPAYGAKEPSSSPPTIEQSNPDAMSISPTSNPMPHSLPSSPPTLPSTTPISAPPTAAPSTRSAKPFTILPLFTLHATNTFTSLIPITDSYSLKAHWEWAAAQWRGVVGPDLTIYVRDGGEGKAVEMSEEGGVCVMTDTTMEGQAIAPTTASDNLLTTTDTPMGDPSTANDVYRSSSATVHIVSDNGGMTQVSTGIQQINGQTGSDKSTTTTYTTNAAQQHSPRAPSTFSGIPTMINQVEQTDSGKGSSMGPADEIMTDTSMDWDADLDTKLNGENIDYGDAIMGDITTAMAAADGVNEFAPDFQTSGDAAENMQNVLADIDDLETGSLSLSMLLSKLNKLPAETKLETSGAPFPRPISASIFGGGAVSWAFEEIPAEPRDGQIEIDGQSSHGGKPVQDPELQMEEVAQIHNSTLHMQRPEPDLHNADLEIDNQDADLDNYSIGDEMQAKAKLGNIASLQATEASKHPKAKLGFEVPDSQIDVDQMVASPVSPDEQSEASDDERGQPAFQRSGSPTGYSVSSEEDVDDYEEPQRTAAWDLRFSTLTGKHATASSWIDRDESGNYDPKIEARKLRKLNRRKKRKADVRMGQDESRDEEMPVAVTGDTMTEDESAPTEADKSVEERNHEDISNEGKNGKVRTGLGESILGPVQPRQSGNAHPPQQYAPVLQNLRTNDGRPGGCLLCVPQYCLHGQRNGQRQGTVIPICRGCQISRLPITQCGHEKIRGIASIQTKMLDVGAAYRRIDGSPTDDPDIWCSLCFNLAVHRCRDVKGADIGCGLALCTECSSAMRKEYDGDLQKLLAAMKRGEAGTRKRGWRTDALLLEAGGPLVKLLNDGN